MGKKSKWVKAVVVLMCLGITSVTGFLGFSLVEDLSRSKKIVVASEGNTILLKPYQHFYHEVKLETNQLILPYMRGKNHNSEAAAYAYPAAQVQRWLLQGAASADYPQDKKICFLTFDDGPSQEVTPLILNTLKEKGAYGTFFVIGPELTEAHKSIVWRQLQEGHAIAAHSWSHKYDLLYPNRVANEQAILKDYTSLEGHLKGLLGEGFATTAFRYPGGHMSWKQLGPADAAMPNKGYYWIDWNSSSGDAAPGNPKAADFLSNVKSQVKPGMNVVVILMHDSSVKKETAQGLGNIIDYMRQEGYSFGIIE